jgi:hypothetical protein
MAEPMTQEKALQLFEDLKPDIPADCHKKG